MRPVRWHPALAELSILVGTPPPRRAPRSAANRVLEPPALGPQLLRLALPQARCHRAPRAEHRKEILALRSIAAAARARSASACAP